MMVSFDKVFKPTVEDEIRSYEKLLELHKEQIGQCSTCIRHIPPVNYPIVTDYGRCQLGDPKMFYNKIVDQSIDCTNYKEDTISVMVWEKILTDLKEKEKQDYE